MATMGLLIVAVAGLVLTALGGLAAVFYARQGRRRNELVVSVKSQPMIVERDTKAGSAISLRYDDTVVADPHLLTAVVECLGPKDITSADFDQGKPLRIAFGVPMIALLRCDGLDVAEQYRATSIDVPPTLLPKGKTFIVSAITDGAPHAHVDAALIDTDVRDTKPAAVNVVVATVRRLMPYSYTIFVVLGAVTTVVAALLNTAEADKLDDMRTNSKTVTVTVTATPTP
ncbi:MAG: hypothetical protein ABWY93_22100 [Mycobacterium sp.]